MGANSTISDPSKEDETTVTNESKSLSRWDTARMVLCGIWGIITGLHHDFKVNIWNKTNERRSKVVLLVGILGLINGVHMETQNPYKIGAKEYYTFATNIHIQLVCSIVGIIISFGYIIYCTTNRSEAFQLQQEDIKKEHIRVQEAETMLELQRIKYANKRCCCKKQHTQ